jgi:ribosomal protein S4
MQAKKNYRLKQILFGRIVLPALGYLKQKQFIQIKRNAAHIKPLAVSNSRPGIFLGRFERRIDILTYKLNFAPTIQ